MGHNSRQSRPPARGVMATTLPTWTMRKGRREERRLHDRRENARGLLSVLCAGVPILSAWHGPSAFHPRDPRAWWGLCSMSALRVCMSLGVLSMMTLASCAGGPGGSWGKWGFGTCRPFLLSPPCKSGMVPGAEGMRARPTSPFSHYFSKGK